MHGSAPAERAGSPTACAGPLRVGGGRCPEEHVCPAAVPWEVARERPWGRSWFGVLSVYFVSPGFPGNPEGALFPSVRPISDRGTELSGGGCFAVGLASAGQREAEAAPARPEVHLC